MTILGQLALGLGFLLAIWGTVVGAIAGHTGRLELVLSARRTVYALFGVMAVATLALIIALLNNDFNVEYVWQYTSRELPTVYTLAALYAGQAGSLLFWVFVLTGFAATANANGIVMLIYPR